MEACVGSASGKEVSPVPLHASSVVVLPTLSHTDEPCGDIDLDDEPFGGVELADVELEEAGGKSDGRTGKPNRRKLWASRQRRTRVSREVPPPTDEPGQGETHEEDHGDEIPGLVDGIDDPEITAYYEHLSCCSAVFGGRGDRRVGSEYYQAWARSRSFATAVTHALDAAESECELMEADTDLSASKSELLERAIGSDRMRLLNVLGVSEDIANVACFGPITCEEDPAALAIADFVETDIVITLDSGCVDHLADMADMPGYACVLEPSPGSKRGQAFIVGNGSKVKNQGQVRLQMKTTDDKAQSLNSIFQVAEITRPLMSVSRICDQGLECLFTKEGAKIMTQKGEVVAKFDREGGLYTATMRLKAPKPLDDPSVVPNNSSGFARPQR